MCNIVCFRYADPSKNLAEQNLQNQHIRRKLLEDGSFYIVQTTLGETHYLRLTIMNPFTDHSHIHKLLNMITYLSTTI